MNCSSGDWTVPPRMEDLGMIARAGADHPIETMVRLEALKRDLRIAIRQDPERVANLAYGLEQSRASLDRKLKTALQLLAQRADAVETLTARVGYLEGIIQRAEEMIQQAPRPWWRWWW